MLRGFLIWTKQYKEYLDKFSNIITDELTPKQGMYDMMFERLSSDSHKLADNEPILVQFFLALQTDIMITLAKLCDIKSGMSIPKFLEYSKKNVIDIKIKKSVNLLDIINSNKLLLAKYNDKILNLREQRNKYFAHYTPDYFVDNSGLEKDFPLSHDDIIDLLNCTIEIISQHYEAFYGCVRISYGDLYSASMYNFIDFYLKGKEIMRPSKE
jgi:hypothetical protein